MIESARTCRLSPVALVPLVTALLLVTPQAASGVTPMGPVSFGRALPLLSVSSTLAWSTADASGQEGRQMQEAQSPIRRAARSAIEDLAKRLGIKPEEIAVVRAEEVDWPDGSVGCPQPGMRYKQMLVNGTFVQLKVGDRLYNYHGSGSRAPTLCISKDEVLPEDLKGSTRRGPDT